MRLSANIFIEMCREDAPAEVVSKAHLGYMFPSWWASSSCKDEPGADEIFFGNKDISNQLKRAYAICASCPVRRTCLEHALVQREEYGIWAGTSARMRERIFVLIDRGEETVHDAVLHLMRGEHWRYESWRTA